MQISLKNHRKRKIACLWFQMEISLNGTGRFRGEKDDYSLMRSKVRYAVLKRTAPCTASKASRCKKLQVRYVYQTRGTGEPHFELHLLAVAQITLTCGLEQLGQGLVDPRKLLKFKLQEMKSTT
ncbi:hypothetical protein Ddye_002606 [Dipteronia dyeriana]|uniref:Uncharacterized protein n=1 Tax=Dipteronia dyeriana TaxID=168575 RepID=A0AAE0CUJ6_9ROSI|nr:hypothetical protein Ddye_002606 [Dipteronia dyeriana]